MWTRWLSFYGTNSASRSQIRVSNGALASVGWSKKVARQRAKEQNADLRDFYIHNLSDFSRTIWSTWMSLGVISESGSEGLAGLR
ncbi:hypothetical protein PITC_057830 [Penicillium italicum]|uniref:Uncharacterized protein n=1 Tax=Penicillium italicum TaxID=40296 RepID=A0A0A2L507_PENIT|nr:hypothetical protein PITC_057830 [Penicillium italicum]